MEKPSAVVERVIEELSGNEALLQMLDTEAASEMLNWGIATATSIVSRTPDLDNLLAQPAVVARLKALRQSMRTIGNWAAGNYTDPQSLGQLRDTLLGHLRTLYGERRELPSPGQLDRLLSQAAGGSQTPHQLILKLKDLLDQRG